MAEKRILGVTKIEIGDIAADGDVSALFATVGQIYKGTASIEQEEGEDIVHESEEVDDPIEVVPTKGKTTVSWGVVDFTPENLVKVLGGTVSGIAPNTKWESPDSAATIEKSIKVTSRGGKTFTYPRASIKARISYALAKEGIAQVLITATIMQPTKTGVKGCTVSH